ncbi:2-dehydropantoate 2-reductase [Streptomyces sp. NPDC004610]|uniref:ketopantoate reductase family protein n=1 Tax=unclassified Streptomyces TaxID=2593676 RepID=UPI0033A82C5A
MKITIVGPGAVGATLAASFLPSGAQVSLLGSPGAQLDAIVAHGLLLRSGGREERHRLPAAADPALLDVPDLVVLCVKSQDLTGAVASVLPWITAGTDLLVVANGVPWWLLATVEDAPGDQVIRSVDPRGELLALLPPSRVLAGVAHFSSSVPAPGEVTHTGGDLLILGEPLGGTSERAERYAKALSHGPVRAELSMDIRTALWEKLLGNVNLNPVSALTGATVIDILDTPAVRNLCATIFTEAAEVGSRLGIPTAMTAEERLDVARRLGAFRTSMLQDSDRGRRLETDAILGAVRELARRTGVLSPGMDAVDGLLSLRERMRHGEAEAGGGTEPGGAEPESGGAEPEGCGTATQGTGAEPEGSGAEPESRQAEPGGAAGAAGARGR